MTAIRTKPFKIVSEVRCANCDKLLYQECNLGTPRRSKIAYEITLKGGLQRDADWFCGMTCFDLYRRLPPEF